MGLKQKPTEGNKENHPFLFTRGERKKVPQYPLIYVIYCPLGHVNKIERSFWAEGLGVKSQRKVGFGEIISREPKVGSYIFTSLSVLMPPALSIILIWKSCCPLAHGARAGCASPSFIYQSGANIFPFHSVESVLEIFTNK